MSDVLVVRGEMQPWTDRTTDHPALAALLMDVLPAGRRTLIVGPHSPSLVSSVLDGAGDTTMLVRSVSDAAELSELEDLQVIAGALDGLVSEPFEVIVAADGLDRVLGYDSDDLSWTERLVALARLATPDAVVVLGLENEFSLLGLLDSRPANERHGDDEWRPLHDDPTRPVSVSQLKSVLPWKAQVYANFESRTLVDADVIGELPTRLAAEALAATDVPVLSPVAEGVETAARAGLLAGVSTGWLAICGALPARAVYAQTGPAVLTADQTLTGWEIEVGQAQVEGDLRFDANVVPAHVPNGVTVESALFRLAAAEDVPAFRKVAARLGEWVSSEAGVLLRWDDIVIDGDDFAFGVSPWVVAEPVGRADLLTAAWWRFHERLIGGHRRHPWPPWMVGDDLVSTWLGMSGVEPPEPVQATSPDSPPASAVQVARGKELAAALAVVLEEKPVADLRSAVADADRARLELFELKGHVFGLERTLGFRDKALKTRENRISELRVELRETEVALKRVRGSRAYAIGRLISRAAQIRKPRAFAGKVKRRIRKKIPRRR
ncbi:hypothetical protein EV646_105183 [Kribbella antiqua]|uniref:Uncharacterized protein n=1 Tax=Kribbella antiqua TaxID=2512217 RepID=A0A4V2S4D6_9ACTN|nr:hypothetical protein [Kribbella antiqua]TCO47630.1 hypothetical protein EV646_105183 [Kribbella antiqua]